MLSSWVPNILVVAAIFVILGLFRKMAPPEYRAGRQRHDKSQAPKPLPNGVIVGAMWALGIGILLLFFVLRGANHLWASFVDGPSLLTQYAPIVYWMFFPGFAALAIPWPLTVWYLRKIGRREEANGILDNTTENYERVQSRYSLPGPTMYLAMKWLSIGVVAPIGIFTVLAIPVHLSIGASQVRVGHYASLHTEVFQFNQARRLTIVDGDELRGGGFEPDKDVIIDFADGRRLDGNEAGDGGTNIRSDVMRLLIEKTGLTPEHARTEEDIPPLRAQR